MVKRFLVTLSLALVIAILIAVPVFSQHQVDLQANVTAYGQESCCWCGAACAQMIMNGYPNPTDRQFFTQTNIWNAIQANNSTNPADAGWCTDPIGLRTTLTAFNPPPGGTWSIHSNTNRDTVMFDILFWMNRNSYPVAVLINQGGHWVTIVGFTSDVEPLAGSNPVLQDITIYDPEPHNVGTATTKTAAVWYSTDWNGAIQYAGTWLNLYVAVIEPPVAEGKVKVKMIERTGDKLISPEQAAAAAAKWIEKLGLAKRYPYAILQRKDILHLMPILVQEESKLEAKEDKRVPHYYLVPYGLENEMDKCGNTLIRVAIIVNAFTGDFEEISAFGQPVKFLPKSEAIDIVANSLRLTREERKRVMATMMFKPGDITHIREYPFWKVTDGKRVMYVDQLGTLYRAALPAVPGD